MRFYFLHCLHCFLVLSLFVSIFLFETLTFHLFSYLHYHISFFLVASSFLFLTAGCFNFSVHKAVCFLCFLVFLFLLPAFFFFPFASPFLKLYFSFFSPIHTLSFFSFPLPVMKQHFVMCVLFSSIVFLLI